MALEGCAAAHIAMAEGGGYNVDEYLENNFQLPDEIMALAKKEDEKRQTSLTTTNKQTLPEVVFALCEEALEIVNRSEILACFYAELLLKMALYSSESAEGHLRCRWGEGPGCFSGDQGNPPRWERTSVSKLKFGELKTKDDRDMVEINTFNRVKKFCELLHEAVSIGNLDSASRVDVAARSARFCLEGVQVSTTVVVARNQVLLTLLTLFPQICRPASGKGPTMSGLSCTERHPSFPLLPQKRCHQLMDHRHKRPRTFGFFAPNYYLERQIRWRNRVLTPGQHSAPRCYIHFPF